jgi:hypothetical protein
MAANKIKQGPKGKATARGNATRRMADSGVSGRARKVPTSHQEISQSRFPGETPLTGEDRPSQGSGGKKRCADHFPSSTRSTNPVSTSPL